MQHVFKRSIADSIRICILIVLPFIAFPQQFPAIDGEALDESHVKIPAGNCKYSIVGMAFNRSAEDALKTWLQPIYETFIKTESKPGSFDMADIYDVNFYFIPMISGFSKVADEFKKNSDKSYWPYIIDIGKTQIKDAESRLSVKDNSIPYFYVLDPQGKILKVISGRFNNDKMDQMEDLLD